MRVADNCVVKMTDCSGAANYSNLFSGSNGGDAVDTDFVAAAGIGIVLLP